MASIVVVGDVSGTVTLAAPAISDTSAIVAEKQKLRDITNQVDTITTLEELKSLTLV